MIRGVKYISLAETTGYGLSALAYIRALLGAGLPVTWHPRVMIDGYYLPARSVDQAAAAFTSLPDIGDLLSTFHAPVEYDTIVVHLTPEHWPAHIEPDKRMVGYTVWETDRLPLHWPHLFAGYDGILTPSTFSRDVIRPHTDSPVAVVPHMPRTDWPDADAEALSAFRRRFSIEPDDFVFYTVNTWIIRKAIWLTLQAFLLAFPDNERAVFVLKTSPDGELEGEGWGHSSRQLFDRVMANYPDPARVIFLPDELAHEDLGLLHLAGDAYASLTRGEGFGMGAYEAAAAGTPVIMTGWSGQLDFLPPEHACLVDYELRPVRERLGDHVPQEHYWAHANLEHAMAWMRRLYENRDEARSRGSRLEAHIAERFNADAVARRFLEALNG